MQLIPFCCWLSYLSCQPWAILTVDVDGDDGDVRDDACELTVAAADDVIRQVVRDVMVLMLPTSHWLLHQ